MTTNPYSPPQKLPLGTAVGNGFPAIPPGWNLCFWLLVVGIAIDIGFVVTNFTAGSQGGLSSTMPVLALIALAQVLMVFAFRWILFRMILRGRPRGDIRGIGPLVGVIVIFTMVKLIEFQGFRLWSGSGDLGKFLVFLVPSLVLLVFMSPRRLVRFQASGRHWKTEAMNGEPIGS